MDWFTTRASPTGIPRDFTEVSTDLQYFTSVIQALCYYEIVSGFRFIKLALEVCGRYF
jgi:hypothetical protein